MEELLAEVLAPEVVMRVELDQSQGPVQSRERAEFCEEHRVVGAKTQPDYPGVHRLLEPGL